MFVAYVDVIVFFVLFPSCSYLFKVVGLQPSLWRERGRAYCRGRDGYGALALDDSDEEDSDGDGGDGLRMRSLRGSVGDNAARDDHDVEQAERGTLLGGAVLKPVDAEKAARKKEQALKQQRQRVEKRRKRQERRQKSNDIWMKAMSDYSTNKQEKHKAALKLMDAYHPGLKARAAAQDDESGGGNEESEHDL
jgi:hypothetical protein